MDRKNMLVYQQIGKKDSKTTLVFLHGSTMTKEGMLDLAKEFEDFNCIVFDLTAHGQSCGEEPEEVSVFAEDVEYSLEQLRQRKEITEQVILLGYSMGGAITCEVAIRGNISLAGMVLLSSGGDLKHHTPLVDQLKAVPVEQFHTEDILDALIGTDTKKQDAERIKHMFSSTKVPDVIGYGDLMASNRYDHLASCKDIDIPALLVHGNDDAVVKPSAAIETWKTIPGSELLMIPYKGHAAIYESTQMVKKAILAFVKQCV